MKKNIIFGIVILFLAVILPAIARPILDNQMSLGRGDGTNKRVIFNRGGSNPEIRWNETSSQVEFSNDGTVFSGIGSGSGGGSGKNYISNSDAESGVTGWATYVDAAGSSPVDGTGGSATSTFAQTSTTPLRGLNSFLLSKPASDEQGEGVSFDFTIDSADKAQVLNVSFDYEIASGTFVSGDSSDVKVFIYDVTNTVLIPVSPASIQGGSSNQWSYAGTFQTTSDSTSYRLILHIPTTSGSAWGFEFDNVSVGPQSTLLASPIGDWTTFTGTGSWVTNTSYPGYWRRVGDSMQVVQAVKLIGTPTSANLTVDIPAGHTIDTAKLADTTNVNNAVLGKVNLLDSGSSNRPGRLLYSDTNTLAVHYIRQADIFLVTVTEAAPFTWAVNDIAFLEYTIPIAGWGSSVIMSNDTDTRVVVALAESNTARSITDGTATTAEFLMEDVLFDTHGAYNNATAIYIAPVSGKYRISAHATSATGGGWGLGEQWRIDVYKNGSIERTISTAQADSTHAGAMNAAGSTTVNCVAGDTLEVRILQESGASLNTATNENKNWVSFERLSGPAAIAPTEKIYLQYTGNATTALTADVTNADFANKVTDSHGAWSGTVFTAPRADLYIVRGQSAANSIDTAWSLFIDGSTTIQSGKTNAAQANRAFYFSRYLTAGQTMSIRTDDNITLVDSDSAHWISIESQ